jgi:hypothetical protein
MPNMLVKTSIRYILWEEDDYKIVPYRVPAYVECSEQEAEYQGLKGEWLKKLIIGIKIILVFISMICLLIKNSLLKIWN